MSDATISPAGMRIVKLLVGTPPQTISALIKAAGVTRTAVAEQLGELIAAGFVEQTVERLSGRGRPRHLYQATSAALVLLFASNQWLLVPAIWQALRELGGEELTQKVLDRVSRALAEHYNAKITAKKPQERLRQYIDLLVAEGGLVEIANKDRNQLVVFKRSCPFISMVDEHHSVCWIDQHTLSAVVGRPIRQTACRHEGAPCCTFEIEK
jgi:DeoR family transcriptional regulator, suf operon transcriptional repressor